MVHHTFNWLVLLICRVINAQSSLDTRANIADQFAHDLPECGNRSRLQILAEMTVVDNGRNERRIWHGHGVRLAFGLQLQLCAQAAVEALVHLVVIDINAGGALETQTKLEDLNLLRMLSVFLRLWHQLLDREKTSDIRRNSFWPLADRSTSTGRTTGTYCRYIRVRRAGRQTIHRR